MKLNSILKAAKVFVVAHGAEIATGVGVALAFTAGVKAVKETPKAIKIVEEKREEKKKETGKDELTIGETVEATWKCYALPIIIFILAAIMILYAQRVTARKAAAFATAYQLSEQVLQEYKEAAKEIVGEKKAAEIQDQAAIQQVKNNPPTVNNIIVTGKGKQLCIDSLSQQPFYSNAEQIRQDFKRAVTDKFASDVCIDFIEVDDWFYQANLDKASDMVLSKEQGWNRSDEPYIDFTSTMGTGELEDIPLLVVNYHPRPHLDKNNPNYAFG